MWTYKVRSKRPRHDSDLTKSEQVWGFSECMHMRTKPSIAKSLCAVKLKQVKFCMYVVQFSVLPLVLFRLEQAT